MDIKENDYYEPDHFKAICEDNLNVSRTCEYENNEMHHIHNSCEILFVEKGCAEYYINGKTYRLEPYDIMVIGPMDYHMRKIIELPYSRYGLTIKPNYYKNMFIDEDLDKFFSTPNTEDYIQNYKNIDKDAFNELTSLLSKLKKEEVADEEYMSYMQRAIVTQIILTLFRLFKKKRTEHKNSSAKSRIFEIKEYVDNNFVEDLNLSTLSNKFFLHEATISKDFQKYVGYNISKYINKVRICEGAKLLENTDDSITDISMKIGYDNVNTFLRQFKSAMEISPLQYRKSIRDMQQSNLSCVDIL